jgi:hypothetical protein
MAIAFVSNTDSSATSTFNHTVAAGTDRALVVCVYGFSGTNVPTGITYDSVAMTKIVEGPSVNYKTSIWALAAPNVGTLSLVISGTGTFGACALNYTGVDQTTPCPENQNSQQVTNAYSPSLNTTVDNSWLVGEGSNDGANSTAGANTTKRSAFSGTRYAGDSNGARTPTGAQALNWTASTSCTFSGAMVSLAPSSGAGPAAFVPVPTLLTLNAG